MADACEVTGYERDDLRQVLRAVPPYSEQELVARKAREFAPVDLTVLCVIFALDHEFGVRPKAIASVGEMLRSVLSIPRTASTKTGLLITLTPPSVEYVEVPCEIGAGILVPLQAILRRVDDYLPAGLSSAVSELNLGPVVIRNQSRKAGS